ncbi:MAG: hypothetical protein SVK08_02115 [Halobacteriota archaeon]|nr:hypothetical protein [Halobacteriota archaeon]
MDVREILSSVKIDELYTRLTGQEFRRVNGAQRAVNVFRDDANPSMTLRPRSNTLVDYAANQWYNHFKILYLTGTAKTYEDQIMYLAAMAGITLSASDSKKLKTESEKSETLRGFMKASLDEMDVAFTSKEFQSYIKDRGLPNDIDFFKSLHIGILPPFEKIKGLPKIKKLLFQKDDQNSLTPGDARTYESIRKKICIVYPLANSSRILTGFRYRMTTKEKQIRTIKFDDKEVGFYGMTFIRPNVKDDAVVVVEGENNLLALASMHHGDPDFLDRLIFLSIGPAGVAKSKRAMYNLSRIASSYYIIHDNDTAGKDLIHGIYKDGTDMIQVINWPSGTPDKFDIEDYLRGKDNRLEAYSKLGEFLSYPEFVFQEMEAIVNREVNKKLRARKATAIASEFMSDMKTEIDRDEFCNLVKEKYGISVKAQKRNSKKTEDGFFAKGNAYWKHNMADMSEPPTQITNFVFHMEEELIDIYQTEVTRSVSGEVLTEGNERHPAKVTVEQLSDPQKLIVALRNQAGYDLLVQRKYYANLPEVIQKLNDPKRVFVFKTIGDPIEDPAESERFFGSKYVLVSYGASVIGPKVIDNDEMNFSVSAGLPGKPKLGNPDLSEQKEIVDYFFNTLMKEIYDHSSAAWLVMGFSVSSIAKPHIQGYPLSNGSTLVLHGRTGTKKSTTIRLAQNFWATQRDDADMAQFSDTTNSQVHVISRYGSTTYSYDEYKPEVHGKDVDIGMLIHNVASGRDRRRLKSDITLRADFLIKCNLMFSAEQIPDISSSQNARLMPVRMPSIIPTDKFPSINEWSFTHQHKITAPMAAWANQNHETVRGTFISAYNEILEGIEGTTNGERVASNYAKAYLGVWIITEFSKRIEVIDEEMQEKILSGCMERINHDKVEHTSRVDGSSLIDQILGGIQDLIEQRRLGIAYLNTSVSKGAREWIKPKHEKKIDVSFWEKNGQIEMAFHERNIVTELNRYMPNIGLSVESLRAELAESGIIKHSGTPEKTSYYWPDSKTYLKKRIQRINVTEKIPSLALYIAGINKRTDMGG